MSRRYEVKTANNRVRYTTLIQYAVISRKSLRFQSILASFVLFIDSPQTPVAPGVDHPPAPRARAALIQAASWRSTLRAALAPSPTPHAAVWRKAHPLCCTPPPWEALQEAYDGRVPPGGATQGAGARRHAPTLAPGDPRDVPSPRPGRPPG